MKRLKKKKKFGSQWLLILITILYYCTTPKHFSKNLLPSLCFYFCHNVIFSNLFQSNSTLYYWNEFDLRISILFLFLLLTEHFSSTILVLFNITYCFLWHNNTKFWKVMWKKKTWKLIFKRMLQRVSQTRHEIVRQWKSFFVYFG